MGKAQQKHRVPAVAMASEPLASRGPTMPIYMLGHIVRAAIVVMLAIAGIHVPVIARADVLHDAYTEVSERFSFKAARSLALEVECSGDLGEPTLLNSAVQA
jgi:hypothetical protein